LEKLLKRLATRREKPPTFIIKPSETAGKNNRLTESDEKRNEGEKIQYKGIASGPEHEREMSTRQGEGSPPRKKKNGKGGKRGMGRRGGGPREGREKQPPETQKKSIEHRSKMEMKDKKRWVYNTVGVSKREKERGGQNSARPKVNRNLRRVSIQGQFLEGGGG